jgi:hypothetical protein
VKNFSEILHSMTYTDEIDHYEHPPKWTEDDKKRARRRIRKLRVLIQKAGDLGFTFNDEYADSPECEIARLEDTLSWIKNPTPRKVFKLTKMAQAQIDSIFDTSPIFTLMRGKALAVTPSPNASNYTDKKDTP